MVLCYGDINIDLVMSMDRLPNEDEELPLGGFEIYMGGSASNVAVGLSRLGQNVSMVGSIGKDLFGDFVQRSLRAEKVDISFLKEYPNAATGVAAILLDSSKNRRILTFGGANRAVLYENLDRGFLKQFSLLHLSSPSEEFLEKFDFKSCPIPVSIDAGNLICRSNRQLVLSILPEIEIFFAGEHEAFLLSQERSVQKAFEKLPVKCFVYKKGKDGSEIFTSGRHIDTPPFPVDVTDTTGAGDAYAAAFLYAYLQGEAWEKCGLYGSAAGALNSIALGAQTGLPTLRQIKDFCSQKGVAL